MRNYSSSYIILFCAAVCIVCSFFVSASAVLLQKRQEQNEILDKRKNVLMAAGLVDPGERLTEGKVDELFTSIEPVVVDLESASETDIDPLTFDQQDEKKDPDSSKKAEPNPAQILRVPNHALVYKVKENEEIEMLVLPIEGKGLWSTLYGFLALDADGKTIRGITFYQHGETPGLGGEIDNRRWKELWPGRKAYDENGNPAITVIKGAAGNAENDPYRVDGLSGATITSRGVTHLLHFWLGENGFGPYIENFRESQKASRHG